MKEENSKGETAMVANIQPTSVQPQQQPQEEWVFLSGRPPMAEYLGFVKTNAADEAAVSIQTLSNEWRAANKRIVELEQSEVGAADNPTIEPVPENLKDLAAAVESAALFKRTFPSRASHDRND